MYSPISTASTTSTHQSRREKFENLDVLRNLEEADTETENKGISNTPARLLLRRAPAILAKTRAVPTARGRLDKGPPSHANEDFR